MRGRLGDLSAGLERGQRMLARLSPWVEGQFARPMNDEKLTSHYQSGLDECIGDYA